MLSQLQPLWVAIATCVAVGIAYRLCRRLRHIYALSYLPGPPTVSYLWGDAFDLRKAPVGTKYREWRRAYGPTYVIHEPFMVRLPLRLFTTAF